MQDIAVDLKLFARDERLDLVLGKLLDTALLHAGDLNALTTLNVELQVMLDTGLAKAMLAS